MSCLNEIGLSRKQMVFAVLESTCGTLAWPNATTDFVRPAGQAVMSQTPTFVDSEELQDTLDVLDQFQNAMPPGEFTVPMYVRPAGYLGTLGTEAATIPQGDPFFRSMQGSMICGTHATLHTTLASPATGVTEIHLSGIATPFPMHGVLFITSKSTQLVKYDSIVYGSTRTTATVSDLTWGYKSSSPGTASQGDAILLRSRFYKQDTDSPSFSLWIETDHFVQGMSGCSVNNATLGVNNEGAVTIEWTGQGMEMVWAGTGTCASPQVVNATRIRVSDARLYSVGARIWNETKSDTGGAGYVISAVSHAAAASIITLASGTAATWGLNNIIRGFLPGAASTATPAVIGSPIESRLTSMELDGVATTFKGGDFTFAVPKEYIADEVGTDFPEDYVENVRSITSTLDLYFKRANANLFTTGYNGATASLYLTFGDTDQNRFELHMDRCQLEVPTITFTAPAVNLSIPMKALGTLGEDSCEIVFN